MKVLHLLAGGGTGGIEILCKDYALFSRHDNIFVILWGTDGDVTKEMKANKSNVVELNSSKKDIVGTFKKLKSICLKEKINAAVVHHAASIAHLYLMGLKKNFPNIKTFTYAHGNAVNMYRADDKQGAWIRKRIITLSLNYSNQVIAISNSVKNSLTNHLNIKSDKVHIIYNGTDIDKFKMMSKNTPSTSNLIYVGRLIKEKGVQITLQALSQLPSNVKYKFRIVGDGAYRKELEDMAGSLGLTQQVSFMGNRQDIPELLRKSSTFIHMPILEEGFGISLIEAMASGLICIGAESGAIPEIIQDGLNGYLVEKSNISDLTSVILSVINGENDDLKLREKAQQTAGRFSISNFATELDDLIEKK